MVPAHENKTRNRTQGQYCQTPLRTTRDCSFHYQETKEAHYAWAPAEELRSWNGGDESQSDILPWQVPLAVCWHNDTLRGEFLQSPITAAAISPQLHPAVVQSHTATPDLPATLMSCVPFHSVASVSAAWTTSDLNSGFTNIRICLVILTNFTVSVVFLYGVVLGEPYPSHPFDALRCG